MPDPTVEPDAGRHPGSPAPAAHEDRALALVELAHQSLVDARTATLLVEGVGRVSGDADGITLCERRGRPVLMCPAVGRLAELVGTGCAAVLTVPIQTDEVTTGTVIFLGRMSCVGTYGSGAEATATLEIVPASIVVEPTVEGGPHEHVDLRRYTAHCRGTACCPTSGTHLDPEDVGRVAERIRAHTNARHAPELVAAVARLAGVAAHTVAGAALFSVDDAGLILDWADETGGHRLALTFTTPARDPGAVARSVRAALEGS